MKTKGKQNTTFVPQKHQLHSYPETIHKITINSFEESIYCIVHSMSLDWLDDQVIIGNNDVFYQSYHLYSAFHILHSH